jgi:putative transposase
MLPADRIARVCEYTRGIIVNLEGTPLAINGVGDHIHIAAVIGPTIALAQFVGTVKSNCSKWIHSTFSDMQDFAWQDGYGAFSVSASVRETVVSYIQNQETHHQKMCFRDELIQLLEKHGVEYNPEYIQ